MKILYSSLSLVFLITGLMHPLDGAANGKDPGKNIARQFPATVFEGMIGTTEDSPFDTPVDNIFHVNIPQNLCPEDQVWLVYELDGVEDHTNVSRSINDQVSVGGYLVRERSGWSTQREKVSPTWLKTGDNIIRFTIPENANYHYRVRNLRVELSNDGQETEKIIFNKPSLRYFFDKAYVKGFFTGAAHENVTLKIDGKDVQTFHGEFEDIIDFPMEKTSCSVEVEAVFADGTTYCSTLTFNEPQNADHAFAPESSVTTVEKYFSPKQSATLSLDNVSLTASAAALNEGALISITTLRSFDIPALDAGLINVTAGHGGFRFLPHGMVFAKDVDISIPFDSTEIPDGYTAQDIRTYYFDEQSHHWVPLSLDTVLSGKIVSKSLHFTDMINGILRVPESPEVEAYNSTSIKGIKAANPSASVNMISPPQSSSTGSASLSFPITIPAGRKGMQPELAVSYSSGAGNGWLGVGWNVAIPMISIDTRWGVPRYDPEKETETYSFNGNMLTPVAHRGELRNRVRADEQFFPRIEGAFYKIIRHGNDPSAYWWEVSDKNGTRYLYGASGNTFDASTVLRTNEGSTSANKGNIAQWCLSEVRDPNGNTVRYHYAKIPDTGLTGGSVPGWQIYIDRITYTGYQGSDGPFVVKFISESTRPDKIITANLGFKQVIGSRLKKIEVRYEGGNKPLIRSYQFDYTQGAFFKTLLTSIKEFDSDNQLFTAHDFNYYDEVNAANGHVPFYNEVTVNSIGDEINGGFLSKGAGFNDKASVLSGSQSENIGGGLAVTVGPNDQNYASKSNTAGINYSYSRSKSEGRILMIDITGDGLPDKVMMFKDGRRKSLKYRRQIVGANGVITFGELRPVNGVNEFLKETSNVHDFGIESNFGIFAGVNYSMTKSKTSIYFTDANGDGLIDIVDSGKVLFNRLNGDGDPTFAAASAGTPNPIVPAGTLDGSLITVNPAEVQLLKDQNPLHDMVRMWRAPFNGTVRIVAPVNLIRDTTEERQSYTTADGVKVSIQLKGQEPLWSETISKDDYSVKTPTGVTSISVQENDAVYFRVHSIEDGAYDQVKWSPIIEYTQHNDTIRDANGKPLYQFNASEDFLMAAEQTLAMPINGKINIESQFIKPATSDSVLVEVIRTQTNGTQTILYSQKYDDQTIVNDPISISSIAVTENDKFVFKVSASSNIRWNDIEWKPLLYYTESQDPNFTEIVDEHNNYLIQAHAVPTFTLYSETIEPSAEWYTNSNDSIDVTPFLDFKDFAFHDKKEINFTIKKQDSLVAKMILVVNDTLVTDKFTKNAPEAVRIRIKKGEKIFFEFHASDHLLVKNLAKTKAHIRFSDDSTLYVKVGVHLVIDRSQSIFGPMYRHWGMFSYNGNGANGSSPIDETKLNVDQFGDTPDPIDLSNSTSEEDMNSDFESSGGYRADKEPFVMMYAEGKKQRWMGNDDLTFINRDTVSSSRMGLDQISAMLPEFSQGAGVAFAVDKISKSNQTSVAASAAVGINGSKGNSRVVVDYLDMNGDRYPDILGEYKIQYSLPGGGLEENARSHDYEFGHRTQLLAGGVSVGGGFPGSGKESGNSPKNSVFSAIGEATSVNVSALWSKDDAEYSWVDINADGLPDRVNAENGTASLNLGYSFAPAEPWGNFEIRKGSSENFAGGLGINIKNKSISAGVGYSRSDNTLVETLQDMNGDGLPDKVSVGSTVTVYFNTGNGFASEEDGVTWGTINQVSKGAATTFSANGAFTIGFPLIPVAPVVKLCINPKIFYSRGFNRQNVQISDVDGDGYPDYLVSTQDGELKVSRSTIGRTNLLREVKRPLGGSFELSYTQIGNTYEMMTSVWALDTVKMYDGFAGDGADVSITAMKYEGGRYDRHERDFYGFSKITTHSLDTEKDPATVYTSVTQIYSNDNFYTKGLMLSEVTADGENRKFLEKENVYKLKDIHSGSDLPQSALTSDYGNAFPALTENIQRFYEGQEDAGKTTKLTYQYDHEGNVISYTDFGDEGTEDDIVSSIEYHSLENPYIIANPKRITVSSGGTILRKRESVIDPSTGDIITIKQFLTDEEFTSYNMEYDEYGNLKKIIRPENANGQRLAFEYEYDDEVKTHAVRVSNSYGYSSESTYDVRYGQVLVGKDLNGNEIKYELDAAGRVNKIIGPYEKNGGYTIAFEYFQLEEIPWARTRHFDPSNPSNALETAVFVDGLGRVLQTKKDAAVFDGDNKPDKEVMVVSGRVKFDALGRMISARYPVTEPVGSIGDFNFTEDDLDPTVTTYDILSRTLKIILPDQSVSETIYGFGTDRDGKNQFSTKSIDPNGKITEQFTDVRQRVTAVKNLTSDAPIWTSFIYNALNEQIEAIDDHGNTTTSVYDNLGRRIERKHPDAGTTTFSYDPAGNLIELTTANLLSDGLSVRYTYEYERLTEITYPENIENNVKYVYGEPGASDNRAGQIVLQEDASGAQEFFYGPLGETIKTIRTIVIPQHDEQTYVTEWTYDTWNRLTSLTYADGEKVTYAYNTGGLLRTMIGKKKNATFNYVNQLGYDKFEQRVFLAYGNGSKITYDYEPDRRRLKNITAKTAAKRIFMDNVYQYDKVNNILSLKNNAPLPSPNLMGGSSEYVFGYDDLYRLTSAHGLYRGSNDDHEYTLTMSYNTLGGILQKDQNHIRKGQQQKKTSYSMQYTYQEVQPHAPVHIGTNTYSYDANGNQTGFTDDRTGQERKILWDEQNRIRSIYDNGSQFHYVYDASGERVLKGKSAGQRIFVNGEWKAGSGQMGNYTVYVNPYLVLQSGGYTKHYFIEGQRIVSKLGGGWDNNGKGQLKAGGDKVDYPGKSQKVFDGIVKNLKFLGADGQILTAGKSGKIPPGQINGTSGNTSEAFRYFYHSDHIGNTGFVTDASGEVFQHIEYFPYGEIFVEEHSNTDRVKYLFNGKELDEETGMYYYGARYYDPKISIWASVDPLAEKFDNWTPYRFGFNNPIRYQDPDGKTEKEREAALAHARKFINANPNPGKSMYGFAGYHAGEPGDPIDCSGLVSQAAHASGFGYLNNIPEQKNGVSNILNQPLTRKVGADEVRRGNIVTMSKRVMWNNIPVGHVALIDRVDRDENGNITGINLLHSKGSAGPVEQYVDFNDANDDYKNLIETFQYWAWDTPEAETETQQPTKTETPSEKGDGKNSSPKWAKSNIIFAHIYFIFTGNDPGLSDRQNDVLNGRNIDK